MDLVKIVLRVILAVSLALAAFAAGPDVVGTWVGTAVLPDQTLDEVTLVLEKSETGLKGKVGDTLGVLSQDTPLTEASFDGKELRVVFPTAEGVIITIVMKPDGEKFVGMWTDEEGESGAVELAKKK
ncbi:MAG: hypothetical protein JW843_01700 [Candidatus Aminicenantes bacterium]|nr:hypothetical protein [Candidatus Aminicenantes bacterium]